MLVCTPIEDLGQFCQCGEIVMIGTYSPVNGEALMVAEFNGSVIAKEVEVYIDQPFAVPNVFNENYTHIIGFYQDGVLLNNKKYAIEVAWCKDIDPSELDGEYLKLDYSEEYN